MEQYNILVVDDDQEIVRSLGKLLELEGYRVLTAYNGMEALDRLETDTVHLILLDVMMPRMNGLELTKALRRVSAIPILILSARSTDNDKILGLNLGADDYIAKPFNPMEVVARVKAQLRRAGRGGDLLTVGDLTLDVARCELRRGGELIPLTPTEYKILALLMRSPGRIFTKAQLYEGVAGEYFESSDNTMMVHISKLREKLEEDPRNPRHIITIRGLGYKIEA